MHEVILATPGPNPSTRMSARPLDPVASRMVWMATTLSLLALGILLPASLTIALMLVFAFMAVASRHRPLSARMRFTAFIAMVAYIFTQGGFGMQSESGTALLIAAMIVKQVEMRTARDAGVMLLFDLVAPFTAMLQNQTPVIMLVSLLALFVASAASLALSESPGRGMGRHFLRSFVFMLAVAPLAAALYLVIPRLDAPMWVGRTSSSTGVTDRMDVSDWTRVINDYSTAFRVHFDGTPPPAAQLYYRGYVLLDFDGKRWSAGAPIEAIQPQLGDPAQRWASYRINYEDRSLQRMFFLDYPSAEPTGVKIWPTAEALPATGRLPSTIQVDAARASPTVLSDEQRQRALLLPDDTSPRTRALAQQWRLQGATDQQVIANAMRLFASDFEYTLSPAQLDRSQPVDSFVFDTREGFCMHYSSALAVLLRAAGIPARVVTGYASAEVSDLGDYYRVRQADAHAWVEAWTGTRWQRLDPTAQVSTVRQENPTSWGATWRNNGYEMGDWFKSYWDRWVSYYDAGAQEQTLANARQAMSELTQRGVANPSALLVWFMGPLVALMGLLSAWRWFRPPTLAELRGQLMSWLDLRAPAQFKGEAWNSRLSRVPGLPLTLSAQAHALFSQVDTHLFDPSFPPMGVNDRRQFARRLRAFLRTSAKLDKTTLHMPSNSHD